LDIKHIEAKLVKTVLLKDSHGRHKTISEHVNELRIEGVPSGQTRLGSQHLDTILKLIDTNDHEPV